jgi:hypothetical protein
MSAPAREGKEGEIYTWENRRGTVTKRYVYREGLGWRQLVTTPEEGKLKRNKARVAFTLTAFAPPSTNYMSAALRYPDDGSGNAGMTEESDYVLFQFFEYKPPFQDNTLGTVADGTQFSSNYNQSDQYVSAGDSYPSIVMYMPEDVSTGFRGNWGGKAISTVGADLLRAAGADGPLKKLTNAGNAVASAGGRLKQIAAATAIKKLVTSVGGDNLSNDDIFGSISGAVLNPNTELLFNSVDMRNFQLNFKLVPRNGAEATTCNNIIKTFKKCTLPKRDPGQVFGFTGPSETAGFIGVPNLCRVSFMKGSSEHDVLPRFKMCAVTQVDVNYTPDGAYATYADGQPVAMTLTLNFQETKICFAEEVDKDEVR